MNDDSFAAPPYKPDEALQRLSRELRALGLVEREGVYARRGIAIARVALDGTVLRCEVVKKPSRNSPAWQPARELKASADVRDFAHALKTQLAAWTDDD